MCAVLSHFSPVHLFAISWTVACQAPLSMDFSRQEHWSGLPFPSPVDLPTWVSCIAGRFFTIWSPREAHQFSSVTQSCLTLCDPMNRSMPDLPVHHQLPHDAVQIIRCKTDNSLWLRNSQINFILPHPPVPLIFSFINLIGVIGFIMEF